MSKGDSDASGGIGFFGMLTIVLITLKLTETGPVASWSWWWVLFPMWMPALIIIALGIIVAVIQSATDSR